MSWLKEFSLVIIFHHYEVKVEFFLGAQNLNPISNNLLKVRPTNFFFFLGFLSDLTRVVYNFIV